MVNGVVLRVCAVIGFVAPGFSPAPMRRKGLINSICGVVKARIPSTPTVAGSSPVSGPSCCSSIGRAMASVRAADSRHKNSGMVKSRVTSSVTRCGRWRAATGAKKLDVVKDRVTSPLEREVVSSILT